MSQRTVALSVVMLTWVLPVGAPLAAAEPAVPDSRPEPAIASRPEIEKLLVPIREKHKVPALVAGIVHGDRLTAAGATGVRKLGSPEPITLADELPIGSDTKAMTATQLALLVDKMETVDIQKTSGGVRFGVLGPKPAAPAPTLFVFAHELSGTLTEADYNKVGKLLRKEGVLCVALDLPCHGQDVRPDEPAGLDGWAARLRKDEDPVGAFTKQASAVLDHLIAEGFTDREKIAVCGTSRGGFMAVHFAADEPRIRCVAAFAPVTELSALREFKGMEKHAGTTALDLRRQADKLAGRPIWMCIGNLDERVDTDRAIAFSRSAVKASAEAKKRPLVELHVMTSLGHTIHPTAHDEAAAWIAAQLK